MWLVWLYTCVALLAAGLMDVLWCTAQVSGFCVARRRRSYSSSWTGEAGFRATSTEYKAQAHGRSLTVRGIRFHFFYCAFLDVIFAIVKLASFSRGKNKNIVVLA